MCLFTGLLMWVSWQDVRFRKADNRIWLAALGVSAVMAIQILDSGQHLLGVLLWFVLGFLLWRVGIWGGADGRWLPLCLVWVTPSWWPVWFFLFFVGWSVYALGVWGARCLLKRRARGLALLPVMLLTHLSVSGITQLR